jgi:hypothetical protein
VRSLTSVKNDRESRPSKETPSKRETKTMKAPSVLYRRALKGEWAWFTWFRPIPARLYHSKADVENFTEISLGVIRAATAVYARYRPGSCGHIC